MADTCYRHPDRETGVRCSNCGRPICPDCMTPSPVGMRCPECSQQTTRVKSGAAAFGGSRAMNATYALIGINVVVYLFELLRGGGGLGISQSNPVVVHFGLIAPPVADGQLYRLLTAGFLHYSILHIAFNMYALFIVGRLLEPGIGTLRFVFLYFASLLAGSFGALLLSPDSLTAGASGAIFGIFAAAFVVARGRRLEGIAAQLGILLVINFVFTFSIPGISIGGHLFGAAGGALAALAIVAGERGRLGPKHLTVELVAIAAIGIAAIVGSVAIA